MNHTELALQHATPPQQPLMPQSLKSWGLQEDTNSERSWGQGAGGITLGQSAERWLASKRVGRSRFGGRVKESTLDFYTNHVQNYLVPTLGKFQLLEITPRVIELMMLQWGEMGLGPKSVNKVLTTLSAVMKKSLSLGEIPANPCLAVDRMGVGTGEVDAEDDTMDIETTAIQFSQVFTAQELRSLLCAAKETDGWVYPLVMVFALTGVRHGEALALMWKDVDFDKRVIKIRRNWGERYRSGEPVFYTPKTKTSIREIPGEAELFLALESWKSSCPYSRWGLCFPNEDGNPHYRKTVWRAYSKILKSAGLRPLSVHALRHTFASLLLSLGTPIPEVSAILGHASVLVTLQVYAHFIPRANQPSTKVLSDAIFSPGR